MDITDLRALTTVLLFAVFLGIVWWAFGKGRQSRFDEAAAIPFTEDDEPGAAAATAAAAEKRKKS